MVFIPFLNCTEKAGISSFPFLPMAKRVLPTRRCAYADSVPVEDRVTSRVDLPRLRGDGGVPWPPAQPLTPSITQAGEGEGLQHDGLINKRQEKSPVMGL